MISIAQLVIDQYSANQRPEVESVPAWQWRLRFDDLAPVCPSRLAVTPGQDFNRQRNALRMENTPNTEPRCSRQSPDGRGLAWFLSGGSPLAYGPCCLRGCPRGAP